PHHAGRNLRKERLHRSATKLSLQNHLPRRINPVDLKNVLRQIQPNHANLVHGRLPYLVESTTPVWHIDAVGGRPPHLCEERSDEAIHGSTSGEMDCFATLAMTTKIRSVLRSRIALACPGRQSKNHRVRSP